VMDKGHIVEQGTHDSLIAANGMYARMVERELKTEDDQEIVDSQLNGTASQTSHNSVVQ
jgi:hypothetical protein